MLRCAEKTIQAIMAGKLDSKEVEGAEKRIEDKQVPHPSSFRLPHAQCE